MTMGSKRLVALALAVLLTAAAGLLNPPAGSPMAEEEIIRLHVVAHSDHPSDQFLKNRVRDRVVELLRRELQLVRSVEEARLYLWQSRCRVADTAREVVAEEGFDYPVRVEFSRAVFPTRMYGDQVYPAGEYEALRVIVGDGKGENWWCVLFPTLCFPVARAEQPEEPLEGQPVEKVEIRWRFWEWWLEKREKNSFEKENKINYNERGL